ncbi:hypothetical protein PNEG_03257 [Pneumocystis murina B123]|uniref:Mitochondrial thiamine pyrophosphate carrier 1 n=1 Tax=Pneumocystis murina (strain B123) TaxID=1069680 RepID=M7NMR5_PNEMU|nr:hypothetical protein PNEG_03257 [Pneumocystis murina B123]EMR08421.1 hypothetical protein PNEG_03257 [Pneumocystis murina B123]
MEIQSEPSFDAYEYETLSKNSSFFANMLAGAFAGVMEHTLMYPIDAIKTRMQILGSCMVHRNMIQVLRWIICSEGLQSLWRGMSSVVAGAAPAHALYFGTYEFVKTRFEKNRFQDKVLVTAIAGACATIASDALMNPFDVIKQRMQIQNSGYTSLVTCARLIFKKEGLWAFYISYPTTLTMTVPFTAIQFVIYESSLNILNPLRTYNPASHILSGGVSGALAAAITTPLDVVKTLLQTRGTSFDQEIRHCKGLKDAIRIIYKKHGMKGFMRGLKPRVVTATPSTAICWVSYEAGKEIWLKFQKNS